MGKISGYAPHLQKVWKSYVYTTGQTIRTVSPFEVNVIGSLVKNVGEKFKHKVTDNFLDVAPGLLTGVGVVFLVKKKRSDYLFSHRA